MSNWPEKFEEFYADRSFVVAMNDGTKFTVPTSVAGKIWNAIRDREINFFIGGNDANPTAELTVIFLANVAFIQLQT